MSSSSNRSSVDRAPQVLVGLTALLLANCASHIGQTASILPLNHKVTDFTANRLDGTPLIGGLVTSTALTLLVLPTLYWLGARAARTPKEQVP